MKKQERANSPINQKLADAMMSVLKIIHDPNHTGQVDPELLERQQQTPGHPGENGHASPGLFMGAV